MQNERFTFEINSETDIVGSTLERRLKTDSDGPQRSTLGRPFKLLVKLRVYWRLFAIRAIFKTPQSNREMRASLPRGGRQPAYFATQYLVLQGL